MKIQARFILLKPSSISSRKSSSKRTSPRSGRGTFCILGVGLVLWLLLAACAPSRDSGSVAPGLRIGTTMSVKQANPVADYYYNVLAMLMTHDSLVRFDDEFNPVPQLALDWGSDRQGQVWFFDLAPQAKWHDGQPVTPEDVAFTFDYTKKHHVSGAWTADLVSQVEIKGNRITFHLKRPYGRFLYEAGFARILPKHIWQNIPDPYRTQNKSITVGSGPYRFDGYDQAAGVIRFKVNTDYYRQAPSVDRISFRSYGTMDLLIKDMTRHNVDLFYQYASGVPAPYVNKLAGQPGLRIQEAMSQGIPAVLGFNLERQVVSSLPVRRAIALAVDYSQINAAIMGGRGEVPSPGLIPPSAPFFTRLAPWSKDVAKAKKLLASSGFTFGARGELVAANGQPVKLAILARSDLWGEDRIVKLLARDLEQIGIELSVRSVDLATYQAFLKQGDYDLILFRTTPWGMQMHAGSGSGYFDAGVAGGLNMCRLNDAEYSRLCDEILATTDAGKLQRLNAQLQRYYADNLPAIALCWGKSVFPYAQSWRGFVVNQLEGGLANRFSWTALKAPAGVKRSH